MSHWSAEEEARIIAELCRRTTVDPDFRKLALTEPAVALGRVTTSALPPGFTYRFVDNSGPVKTIALPDPLPDGEELSDAELEQIAGGDWANQVGYTGG